MTANKSTDLVLYGATGFTGKIACEYISSKGESFFNNFKWVIAGRNSQKLELLKKELVSKFSFLESLEIFIADSSDSDALDVLTSKCKAVISFAGPYSKYGSKLVESCVKNGTHYADLTGEVFWIAEMIEKFEERAKETKTKLIPSCGFDSIPSDWGAYSIAKLFRETLNEDTKYVEGVLWNAKGGFSGGTVASGFEIASPENIQKHNLVMNDPQALNAKDKRNGLDVSDRDNVTWDSEIQQYLAPFIMGPGNSRIVRRSNVFNNYGPDFTYNESVKSSWLGGKAIAWGLYFANWSLSSPWVRPIAQKVAPKPGEGPKQEDMKNGFAHMKFFGQSSKSGKKAVCNLMIKGDPGYLITARMIVEAGVDLAKETESMDAYGFRTPASGLSEKCFEALLQNGFEVKTSLVQEFTESTQ
ncbi:putative trans-acting enoyl reductase Rv2449c [Symsagittifera roscoffensis]|uniref:putative trans-acting enoyl reductase Rv2449c n=1 Tax=Symsagittifera roscoffensis TaxID=84072 RepID=UPI00307B56A3